MYRESYDVEVSTAIVENPERFSSPPITHNLIIYRHKQIHTRGENEMKQLSASSHREGGRSKVMSCDKSCRYRIAIVTIPYRNLAVLNHA